MQNFLNISQTGFLGHINKLSKHSGKWFFLHVPKTAGSSLVAEMTTVFPDYKNIVLNYTQQDDQTTQKHQALNAFVQDTPQLASGHFLYEELDRAGLTKTDTKLFTFLRSPVSRVISEYNYSCSELHPRHESFSQKYPTIEHYINAPTEQNKMSQYLLGPDIPDNKQDIKGMLNERYAFIGLQERYPVSFLLLSNILWAPNLPKAKKQRVLQNEKSLQLQRTYSNLIGQKNDVDMKIFQILSMRYDQITDMVWRNIKPSSEG